MANVVTTQIIADGPRNTVLLVTGVIDTGDLAPTVIADPATLVGVDNTGTVKAFTFICTRVVYSMKDGMEVRLAWEGAPSEPMLNLVGRGDIVGKGKYLGIPNNCATPTGRITLAMQSTGAGIRPFTCTIELVKVGTNPLAVAAAPSEFEGIERFMADGAQGKTLTLWGDSTSGPNAVVLWNLIDNQLTEPGGLLDGMNVVQLGLNGQTMAGANVTELMATNPDCVCLCFGINDTRLGGVTVPDMMSRITTKVAAIRAINPNVDFIFWTPNSLLTTDVGGLGYVVPNASAQAYTDTMWNAYNNLVGTIPNAVHLDKQEVFGRVCQPTSPLMDDQLHPNNEGQRLSLTQLLTEITPVPAPIDMAASAAAMLANPTAPWTLYSRVLEDTRYFTLRRRILITNYGVNGADRLLYFGTAFGETNIVPSDFDSGIIWTPNGVYELHEWEGKTNIGDDGVNMYSGVPIAEFPSNDPPLYNAKLYRRV